MNKKLLFGSIFLFASQSTFAYQLQSNHSYFKDSNFESNYAINIKGYGDFKVIRNENNDKSTDGKDIKNSRTNINSNLSIDINLEGEINELSKYGINFIQTFNSDIKREDEFYGYIDGIFGRLEIGNTTGIAENMRISADTFAVGSMDLTNGNYYRLVNLSSKFDANKNFLINAGPLSSNNFGFYNKYMTEEKNDDIEENKYLSKINYYSPEFYGLQIGFGMTPNVKLNLENINNNDSLKGKNVDLGTFLNYGVTYIETLNNFGISLSYTGESNISNSGNKTDGKKEKIDDKIRSDEFGINLNYFGLTIGGSYGISKFDIKATSPISIINMPEKGKFYTYGIAYELNNFLISATHFNSEYDKYSKFSSNSFAIEKKLGKNASVYTQYIMTEAEDIEASIKKQKGNSIFLGMSVSFE